MKVIFSTLLYFFSSLANAELISNGKTGDLDENIQLTKETKVADDIAAEIMNNCLRREGGVYYTIDNQMMNYVIPEFVAADQSKLCIDIRTEIRTRINTELLVNK